MNTKRNAQTLCQTCNLWKMVYVDRPSLPSSKKIKRKSDKVPGLARCNIYLRGID
jgi:hypothetical protein